MMKSIVLPNHKTVSGFSKTDTALVYHEIYTEDTYLKHGITVKEGDCIIDAGANIGLFSVYLAEKYPRLHFYLFEPVNTIANALERNARNFLQGHQYHVIREGLSNKQAQIRLDFCPLLSVATGMYAKELGKHYQKAPLNKWYQAFLEDYQKVQVQKKSGIDFLIKLLNIPLLKQLVTVLLLIPSLLFLLYLKMKTRSVPGVLNTVSAWINKEQLQVIDVFKIDVEGAELDVLMGIEENHWPRIRQFVIEVHDIHQRVHTITALLEKHAYTVTVDQENWRLHELMNIYTVYAKQKNQ